MTDYSEWLNALPEGPLDDAKKCGWCMTLIKPEFDRCPSCSLAILIETNALPKELSLILTCWSDVGFACGHGWPWIGYATIHRETGVPMKRIKHWFKMLKKAKLVGYGFLTICDEWTMAGRGYWPLRQLEELMDSMRKKNGVYYDDY